MSRRTILIIDEAADHRDILCRFLRATGYDVVEASPGPELLNATPIFDPDLILLDLTVPGYTGWDTALQLRNNSKFNDVPIVGATLFTTLWSQAGVKALGCIEYLDKPFDLDLVLNRIRNLLPEPPTLVA